MIYRITTSYSKRMSHIATILNVLAFVGWVLGSVLIIDFLLLWWHLIKL